MKKTVLKFDGSGYATFKKSVEKCCSDANVLVNGYNERLHQISKEQEAQNLIKDPVQMFDDAMFEKLNIDTSKAVPLPDQTALMYGIDRKGFLSLVFGAAEKVKKSCSSCSSATYQEGYYLAKQFEGLQPYLTFTNGSFTVNYQKVIEAKELFTEYANDDQQAKLDWLNAFVGMVNDAALMGVIETDLLNQFKKFSYLEDTRKISLPYDITSLLNSINLKILTDGHKN